MPRKKRHIKGLVNKPEGSKNFYGTFYDRRLRPSRRYVPLRSITEEAAEREYVALQNAYALGRFDPWRDRHGQDALTLREAADLFLAACSGLAEATIAQKRSVLSLFSRSCRAQHAATVTESDVETFILESTRTESTRSKRLSILNQFFRYLQEEGLIEDNPAEVYARRRRRNVSIYAREKARSAPRPALMPRAVERMAEAAREAERISKGRSRTAYNAVLFPLAATTGLRLSEIIHINWRDVDLRASETPVPVGLLHVRAWTNPATGERFVPKNGKDRAVHLMPRAALLLRDLKEHRGSEDPWEPVFAKPRLWGDNPERRLAGRTIETHFKRFGQEAALPEGASFHSFRHSFMSWLVMLEVNWYRIMQLAGHQSLEMQRRYVRFAEDFLAGRKRQVQRELFLYLCPGISEAALDAVLPRADAWRRGAARPLVPIEDALFGAALYAPQNASAGSIEARFAEHLRNDTSIIPMYYQS